MPYQVGDLVFILSSDYTGENAIGLRAGSIGVLVRGPNSLGGAYLTGLPGTPAAENYPGGLYFLEDEYEPVTESEIEVANMDYDWEGKYYRDEDGWVVGPLVKQGGYARVPNRYYLMSDLTSVNKYEYKSLVGEPLDVSDFVMKDKVEIGDCVEFGGKFWWVTRKDIWDNFFVTHNNCLWKSKETFDDGLYKVHPKLALAVPGLPELEGKWVWNKEENDYLKISDNSSPDFKKPIEGFSCELRAYKAGSSWKTHYDLADFDLTKVLDKHPYEDIMVRGIQGSGQYLYAVSRKNPEHRVIVGGVDTLNCWFYNLDDQDISSYYLNSEGNVWWNFQVFATDTPPDFGLPFSWGACVDSISPISEGGYNELQRWLLNNAASGVAPAILHRAKMASTTRGNIALYLTEKQIETQKIQSLRPGKALRVLMPNLTDAELERLVDKFRKDFPTGDYVVKRGFEAADFKRAYSGAITNMQNPQTSYARKSLANSCMRHDFSHLKHHPAEAYASGEFEMLWTETPDGLLKIGSRMVVWHPPEGHRKHGTPQCGPVYGTCEYSMDLLQNLMVEAGAALFNDATWVGAKLQRLNKDSGTVFLPFIDSEQGLDVYDDYLEISDEDPDDCDCAANNTCGYANISSGCTCAHCGHRMDEDEAYSTDDGDMCDSCYHNNYFICEEYHDTYPIEESTIVYYSARYGRGERVVCEGARDNNYTLCTNDEWWHSDDVLFLANGDALSPQDRDEAYLCIKTEEYYLISDVLFTVDGEAVCKEYYDGHKDEFTMNADGELEEVREAA